ncbi:MAG: HD domain-containing protein [Burkholderiales bacterium]|nr:HD domain-containing protein [Burkholderiales bacterium]
MARDVSAILELYASRGARWYGSEAVSQLEHALQCAALALEEGASEPLVAAALLHDLGHLVTEVPHSLERDVDDAHERVAVAFLRGLFPAAVLEPIRLHVDAKRFLCRADRRYLERLSSASRHSLELQGGPLSPLEAERFIARPYALDAVRLRRWDDRAKEPGARTPGLADFEPLLRRVSLHEAAVDRA